MPCCEVSTHWRRNEMVRCVMSETLKLAERKEEVLANREVVVVKFSPADTPDKTPIVRLMIATEKPEEPIYASVWGDGLTNDQMRTLLPVGLRFVGAVAVGEPKDSGLRTKAGEPVINRNARIVSATQIVRPTSLQTIFKQA